MKDGRTADRATARASAGSGTIRRRGRRRPASDALVDSDRIEQMTETLVERHVWRAPVSLSIEGTFPQLFEFIRGVEILSQGLELTSIEIDQAGDPSEALRMKATLRIFGPGRDFPVTQDLPISR